jgi:hypothetical protein
MGLILYQPFNHMKHLTLLLTLLLSFTTLGNDLDPIQGTWMAKKTGDNGPVTQTFQVKKDKWTFKVTSDGNINFVASGELEFKKAGPFNSLRLYKIKYGANENELSDADEERNLIFILQDGLLYVANNFDQERNDEKPTVDVYTKTANSTQSSNEILGNWKLDIALNETNYDYTLRLAETDGKLTAVMVSPRSGDHKVKTVSFANNTLQMEMDREISNMPVTFLFTGKLAENKLSGKVTVKNAADDISGTWTATK